jgi:hypothetical protein
MKRRDFLKSATLAAGANAVSALTVVPQHQPAPETDKEKPLRKIALEEHFLLPDFVEYFAETYPNISPEIAKMGLSTRVYLSVVFAALKPQVSFWMGCLRLTGPERAVGVFHSPQLQRTTPLTSSTLARLSGCFAAACP